MAETIIDRLAREVAVSGEYNRATKVPAIRRPAPTVAALTKSIEDIKSILDTREGASGSVLDKSLTLRDLLDSDAMQLTLGSIVLGGTGSPAVEFPAAAGGGTVGYVDPRPVLAAAPTPTDLVATGTIRTVFLGWQLVDYQNHSYVQVWRAATNSLGAAVQIGVSDSNLYVDSSVAPSTVYYYWVRAVAVATDGSPLVGSYNAVSGTSGGALIIGNTDLGALVVEAANLANGSITAPKLNLEIGGGNRLTNSSFEVDANSDGIANDWGLFIGNTGDAPRVHALTRPAALHWSGVCQRVQITSAGNTNDSGIIQTVQGVAAGDACTLSGYVRSNVGEVAMLLRFLGSGGAALADFTSAFAVAGGPTQRLSITGVAPAGTLYAEVMIRGINAAGEWFEVDCVQFEHGDVLTSYAPRPDEILPNTITSTEIADNAITTPKLVAGAVVAGKIAANAVSANEIAANSIQAQHILVAPKSLWPDPDIAGGAARWAGFSRRLIRTDPAVPAGCPTQYAVETTASISTVAGTRDTYGLLPIPCSDGERFKISFWWNRGTSTGGGVNPEVVWWNSAGAVATGALIGARVDGTGWIRVSAQITVPSSLGYVGISPAVYLDGGGGYVGTGWFSDVTLEKVNDASLIVDGSIVASKLAANSIAVGTAAIQNGAIVNAMIGTAAIDDAKIANLSADKVNAGTLDAARIAAGSLNADKITAGTIQADRMAASLMQSDNVLTRGLTVRDGSGNIILAAGTPLNVSNIGGLGAFALLTQITPVNVSTYIASAAIGSAYISDLSATKITAGNIQSGGYIRSTVYTTGSAGWTINADGTAEFRNVLVRGDVQATSVSGASGTFGTVTAGLLRNPPNTAFLNLNATGTQDFLSSGSGAVRITADGDAFFRKVMASGTWTGSTPVIVLQTVPTTAYLTPEVDILIDTGYNVSRTALLERSLSARVGQILVSYNPSESSGQYIGNLQSESSIVLRTPLFANNTENAGQNPYALNQLRVFVRVRVQLADRDAKTDMSVTSIAWTVDAIG